MKITVVFQSIPEKETGSKMHFYVAPCFVNFCILNRCIYEMVDTTIEILHINPFVI